MKLDSSEARKSAPDTISSGWPKRAHRDLHQAALAGGVVGHVLGEQRGEHGPGAQRVGPNVLAGVDGGDLACHRQHGALGGGIGRSAGCGGTQMGDEAGDVDDRPAARPLQRRGCRPSSTRPRRSR
jgi:hypothetical protein